MDYTLAQLPGLIRTAIEKELQSKTKTTATTAASSVSVEAISGLLRDCIAGFDQSLTDALLALFPDVGAIERLTDEEIQERIRDTGTGGDGRAEAAAAVARCMRGTTALVALTDPRRANLWVASLGDCVAGEFRMFLSCFVSFLPLISKRKFEETYIIFPLLILFRKLLNCTDI